MTQLPGAPIGSDDSRTSALRSYTHVPRLHELLPNGGWPGVRYAQVCVHNIANARERVGDADSTLPAERIANLRPIRGTSYYIISGPEGEVQMALVGTGTPIPGAAPEGGAREFYTDGEVGERTGLAVERPIWLRTQREIQGGEGHGEVDGTPDADWTGAAVTAVHRRGGRKQQQAAAE